MLTNTQTPKALLALAAMAVTGSMTATAADPYARPDGSVISISGTVTAPRDDRFVLDYGEGTILVEMDDWDNRGDAQQLMEGYRVTVYGEIDDDFFELAKIEAGSVYVESLNTFFYSNSADEEGASENLYWVPAAPVALNKMTLWGSVVEVDREDREFTISTGRDTVVVDTSQLSYNPLDDYGFQQIDRGDFVSVAGNIDYRFVAGKLLRAENVTTLIDDGDPQQSLQRLRDSADPEDS